MRNKSLIAFSFLLLVIVASTPAQQPPQKVMDFIAVLDLKCGDGVKQSLAAPLTNVIIQEIVKIGKYTVIDRANRDKILSEQGFQQTGCASDQCVVEMGRLLGVGKLVVGSIDLVGQTYLVNLQIVNVQTGAVERAEKETCKCSEEGLIQTVENVARKLMGLAPAQPSQPISPEAAKKGCYMVRAGVVKKLAIAYRLKELGYPVGYITISGGNEPGMRPESAGREMAAMLAPAGVQYMIVIGPYDTQEEAIAVRDKLKEAIKPSQPEVFQPGDCAKFMSTVQKVERKTR